MKKAPNFLLESTNGKIIELNKVKSKFIVLYFYPKDDTPGCTIETKDFNSLLSKFKRLNCTIYGISKDNIESHKKFKKNIMLSLICLPMQKKRLLNLTRYGGKRNFWEKNLWA